MGSESPTPTTTHASIHQYARHVRKIFDERESECPMIVRHCDGAVGESKMLGRVKIHGTLNLEYDRTVFLPIPSAPSYYCYHNSKLVQSAIQENGPYLPDIQNLHNVQRT